MTRRSNPLPESVGRFRVESWLGGGGMGEVYKAFDPTLQRTVAVKVVRPDIDRPEYLQRLYREAQACARLTHPNIVTVYEAGELDGVVFIAMEFLKGEDLSDVLRHEELSLETRLEILIQVLHALEHAHANDVIHRDIKPGNVYRQADGAIKLVDFGLAHVVRDETMTRSGPVMGTPDYASPEQLKGLAVDRRSDIYSVGVLAYQLVSGRRPFGSDTDSVATVVLKVISEPAPPMDVVWTRAFPEIERIVSKAMAKSPDDRYQSAAEMKKDLAAFLSSSREAIAGVEAGGASAPVSAGAATLPAIPVSHSSRRWWAVAAGVVIVAVIIGANMARRSSDPATETPPTASLSSDPGRAGATAPAVQTPTPATPQPPPAVPGAGNAANALPKPSDPPLPAPPIASVERTARELFFGGVDVARASAVPGRAAASANAGLSYRLIRQSPDGREAEVDPATEFRPGDGVRFGFESNTDGYLYVVQLGTSGRWTVLFPNPEINGGRNAIKRFERHLVPNEGWFRFEGPAGTEQVFVFLSKDPLQKLPGFDRPVTKLETLEASVVKTLQQQIRSRDLVFQKDRADAAGKAVLVSYVVNRDEVGRAVSASIQLKHGQAP